MEGMITSKQLVKDYVKLMANYQATVFVGAGLSIRSGFPSWTKLMERPKHDLRDAVGSEQDNYRIAEMYVQKHGRNAINDLLIETFRKDHSPDDSHKILARLPFREYWTSNYDKLIEASLRNAGKEVNAIYKDDQFAHPIADQVKLYKIHGCVDDVSKAVITRNDLEIYHKRYEIMLQCFYTALAKKTFLFLGFGLEDDNFRAIIGRLRSTYNDKGRVHYALLKEPTEQPGKSGFPFLCQELNQYGIKVCRLASNEEVLSILSEIESAYIRRNIMIAGSHVGYHRHARQNSPSSSFELDDEIPFQKVESNQPCPAYNALLEQIGNQIMGKGYVLHTGYGLGACDLVVEGAAKQYSTRAHFQDIFDKIFIFPLPHKNAPLENQNDYYRRGLVGRCGFQIIIRGNQGDTDYLSGTYAEYIFARTSNNWILNTQQKIALAAKVWVNESIEIQKKEEYDKQIEEKKKGDKEKGLSNNSEKKQPKQQREWDSQCIQFVLDQIRSDYYFEESTESLSNDMKNVSFFKHLLWIQQRLNQEKKLERHFTFIRLLSEQWKLVARTASMVSDRLYLVKITNPTELEKPLYSQLQTYLSLEKEFHQNQFSFARDPKKSKAVQSQRKNLFSNLGACRT